MCGIPRSQHGLVGLLENSMVSECCASGPAHLFYILPICHSRPAQMLTYRHPCNVDGPAGL